ncbi:PKD domain-containing protein [Lacibacter sediminis]|uniref:PKD domain-containing protein n=1 Tax=Lacibacter sediminis TaxID=2760713 RepID=A0A7G5XC01_9BACT|nr:PKD domain-containing protein [Lacibacter sediminis]QNA43004.1 PKD domain-containing protein [Lacibacter sediminis]
MTGIVTKTILTFFLLFISLTLNAQLNAEFSITNGQGCVPLKTSFSNLSTGISASTVYSWNFGNGNLSSLKDPSAVFLTEGSYTVTLTVKDGNQTSTKTREVKVYKKPQADFTFSSVKGCSPLTVTFNSTSIAGDGIINSYFWDFGDGSTQQTYSPTTTHTYQIKQKASVSLTVVNQYGCYNTIVKNDIIDVLDPLTADFEVDQAILCRITDEVQFTNKSAGPGVLSYGWDFGDGTTSAEKDPKHVFAQKGVYSVKLTVTTADGCSVVKSKQNLVNVASFKSDFTLSGTDICTGNALQLTASSAPAPTQSLWYMGDGSVYNELYGLSYYYTQKGSYDIKLVNTFGTCKDSVTKTVNLKEGVWLRGFVDSLIDKCGAPARMQFRDTTPGAIKWDWSFEYDYYNQVVNSTIQNPVHTYPRNITYNVFLKVSNAEGCSSTISKYVSVASALVEIRVLSSSTYPFYSCIPYTIKFTTSSSEPIATYKWIFPDGSTSTDPTPEYLFSAVGTHNVFLNYTTVSGCSGTVQYNNIQVLPKPVADFISMQGTDICGNSLTQFKNLSTNMSGFGEWFINGEKTISIDPYFGKDLFYKFKAEGKYSISLVATNNYCRDTMTKIDYITVKAPFVYFDSIYPDCSGTGGDITFTEKSENATGWRWDFGDGSTPVNYTTYQSQIKHTYTATGIYYVKLSVTNGSCTVTDSAKVTVIIRKKPQLTVNKSDLCLEEKLSYAVSGLAVSPLGNYNYLIYRVEYEDGSEYNGVNRYFDIDITPMTGYLLADYLDPAKSKLRFILLNKLTNCLDTTNYITYKVRGVRAKFEVQVSNHCFNLPVVFNDTSDMAGVTPIISREWNFGDGQYQAAANGGLVTHTYASPGYYYPTLKVTDASGCTSTSEYYTGFVQVNGPKASFYTSGTNVPLNTTVNFNNTSNTFNTYNTQYSWDFGNGVTSTQHSPAYTFITAGTYTVKLTASDPVTGCTSEATQIIVVRDFNSAFNFNTSFVGNASCPPVMARFNNTSAGAVRVKWDFGDGTTADNVNYPSHIYTKAGTYIVTLYVYGYNGLTGTYTDSVKVKGLDAAIKFDPKETCSSQPVNFNASATGVTNYVWDFGDGQLFSSTDSSAVHSYRGPGVYKPSLLITNTDGCTVAAPSTEKITIDSLSAKIKGIPLQACNQVKINFNAEVYSVGAAQNQNFLSYKWNFGTGNAADTANTANPVFQYSSPGTYTVTLRVTARSGCVKDVTETVVVKESSKGTITAPSAICAGETATFTSAATITNGVQWSWDFKNGQTATTQNPSAQTYTTAGSYPITLVVNNQGCLDTAMHILTVNTLPVVQLSPTQPKVCLGSSIQLTAAGGTAYQWSLAAGLSDPVSASPFASPSVSTTYRVLVTNQYGCKKTDSVTVRVVQPISITGNNNYSICEGESAQLIVTGASSYKWINNTQGLGSTSSGSATASPTSTTTYTVVGYDAENCFTDTLDINVVVHPRPTVNAGPDVQSLPGNSVQLNATGSNNISTWMWRPPDFLSCVQCPSPVSSTNRTITYIVEAKTDKNCSASDSVTVEILCNGSQIFIPNSFTPNGDGKNDYFSVLGNGASLIKLFVIYDRWGNKVFERKNVSVDDPAAKWDGNYKGYPAPIGSFTYSIQLTCDATGESFVRSGTVIIIR